MDLNRAMIIGRLTQDPDVRTTPGGNMVASFSVATNRRWQDKEGNRQERVEYHNVVAWRRLAEIVQQYVQKGRQVYIDGYLQTRTWEGKDGQRRSRTEIVADTLIMLGGRSDARTTEKAEPAKQPAAAPAPTPAPAPQQQGSGKDSEEEVIRIEDIPF